MSKHPIGQPGINGACCLGYGWSCPTHEQSVFGGMLSAIYKYVASILQLFMSGGQDPRQITLVSAMAPVHPFEMIVRIIVVTIIVILIVIASVKIKEM